GFGGGIYYENENGKELTLQNVQMDSETAKSGGAIYAATPTILKISDSVFSENEATQQDGGAVYFNSVKSQLDITGTQFLNNIAKKNGGAVYLPNESIVKANRATFSSNKATNGGAIGIGSTAELYLSGSTFNNNTAIQNGGAIWINDTRKNLKASDSMSILEIDSSAFRNNEAFGNGGAIYTKNTEIISNDKGVTFSDNKADQNGGALYAENSDLNLINVTFFNNEAKKGGAIYFLINKDNVQDREITLTTTTNAVNYFTGNKSDDKANSIYFDVEAQDKISKISLNVKSDGILNMVDPMVVDIKNQNLDLDIVKSGSGKWSLGGTNDFSNTKTGTTFDVKSGIFELQNGSELLLTNNNDTGDYFKLYSGATFATTGPVTASAITNLKTTSLDFAVGSKMQLDGNLALNIENIYTIASTLSGSGGFTKQDDAVLTFSGITNNYNGNVTIEGGSFIILKDVDVAGTGHFITEKGDFFMDRDTELKLHADLNQPSLVAKTVSIDKVYLDISGISSNDQQKEFILIHTTDGITGNFNTVNGKTETFASEVDYLTFSLGFLNDRKDYGGTIGLRWYSKNETLQASGVFTLPKEENYFNVGVELHDNKTNLEDDWGGTTLDKYGLGTLELSATNTYSGKTTVHGGELLLTDKQGTGLGNAVVEVQRNTRLGLNFDGKYTKTITGMGQVIQHGGTVELTGNNTYTGGTVLKNGTMEFTADNQFGTGTITFDGGTLRNKAETSLKRTVLINDNKNAQFDTPLFSNDFKSSLTFNGTISGKGGLEKTGDGILTLTGKNTFEGTSYVRNGGLNIEGSVESDVRVQPFAAVSGSGNIKGDLFISRDGYFDWYFSPNQAASEPLNVTGSLYLAEGAVFRPRTDSANFTNQIVNWTVLTYGKTLGGQFLAVDDTFNAFYNFELDYSVKGEIRVNGELLSHPRALGDVVTTGLSIANRKLYRNAFIEMLRETMYRKTATRNGNGLVRGQAVQPTRSVWFTPSARANRFASTFVGGIYDFEAYGMQTGSTFWSNNNSSLGLMIGYERGALRNRLDWIRSHDYQIGLYFGHIFRSGSEFRSFIGGGFQTFTASRNDMVETYMTKYDGSSFEINTEFGKLFAGQNGTLFRPYFAVDIEYSGQTAAQEKEIGNAFRHYGRADLSQFFVRFGADVEKRWQYVDINGGASYTGLLFGQTRAQAPIFYPTRGAGTTSYGARLGRSSITLKTGLNWHLNRQRVNTIFLDYFADIYLDRTGKVADTMQHSGNLGILVRF
ncbi:MAG: autotransporter domain-containing protein, partial [Planctomycetaceae bacterium]|nr:autotransporter domain-containing protein [Planctomycetaceae bacterium]